MRALVERTCATKRYLQISNMHAHNILLEFERSYNAVKTNYTLITHIRNQEKPPTTLEVWLTLNSISRTSTKNSATAFCIERVQAHALSNHMTEIDVIKSLNIKPR